MSVILSVGATAAFVHQRWVQLRGSKRLQTIDRGESELKSGIQAEETTGAKVRSRGLLRLR